MRLNALSLEYFRNYLSARAEFHPGMNIICGDNAQGKTNLLEGISYLAGARSHRARYDRELIMFGIQHGFLTGELECRGRDFNVEITLNAGQRRVLKRNGVKLQSAAELGETLNTVLFCPEDLFLIRAGAVERRRFLDDAIAQLRPRYAEALERYQKICEEQELHPEPSRRSSPTCWPRWTTSPISSVRPARSSPITAPTSSSALPGRPPPSIGSFPAAGRPSVWPTEPDSAISDPLAPAEGAL